MERVNLRRVLPHEEAVQRYSDAGLDFHTEAASFIRNGMPFIVTEGAMQKIEGKRNQNRASINNAVSLESGRDPTVETLLA